MTTAAEIAAKHQPNGHFRCGIKSLGPITLEHVFSDRVEAKVLTCTRKTDAEGNHVDDERYPVEMHVDGNCCWRPHPFFPQQAGTVVERRGAFRLSHEAHTPTDRQVCVECRQDWPCDVFQVTQVLTLTSTVMRAEVGDE